MNFKFRKVGDYLDVSVTHDNIKIDLGLLNNSELEELLSVLREASGELERCLT